MKTNFIDDINANSCGIKIPCVASNSKFVTLRNTEGKILIVDRNWNVIETDCEEITRKEATAIYKEYLQKNSEEEQPKVLNKKIKNSNHD